MPLRVLLAKARELIHRRQLRADTDDEMQFHLEMEVEHNIARGMTPDEARRAAALAFGGTQRFREDTNEARGYAVVDSIARDIRHALRRLRRAPTFALGAVATLAIGLAAFVGVGTLAYGVLVRPLPYPDPDRIVRIDILTPGLNTNATDHAAGTFQYFREYSKSFSAVAGFYENNGITLTDGNPERATSAVVTPNALSLVGAVPAAGRLFSEENARADSASVVISYDVWQRRYGGSPDAIGQWIEINRGRRRIIGVLPKGFDFPSTNDAVWFPTAITAKQLGLTIRYITAVARLRPGVTPREAELELTSLVPGLTTAFPETSAESIRESGFRVVVRPLRDAMASPVRGQLTLLSVVVAMVLLIAATNVATLFLLRAERLRGEVAVSRALGASHGALTQRFVVEGLVVATLGALLAIPIVAVALSTKFGFSADRIPRLHEIQMTPWVVTAVFLIATAVGALLGLASAARAGDGTLDMIRDNGRSTGGRTWRRAQQMLVATQIALALALLLSATLMTQSLVRLGRVDIGMNTRDAATFETALPFRAYPRYQLTADFHYSVLSALTGLPGITAAAASMNLPLTHAGVVEQRLVTRDGREATASPNVVTPNFFSVMGIPMRGGRTFETGDVANPTPSVIVSASLARDLFGTSDPIGRDFKLVGSPSYPAYRVVGIVGDVYGPNIPDGPRRTLYFPLIREPGLGTSVAPLPYNPAGARYVVRSAASIGTLRPMFAEVVARFDARVPISQVGTLASLVETATAQARLTMMLLAIAAVATLALGGVGLYSVIAYAVTGRRGEFAVRLALGATSSGITGLVLREGVLVSVIGAAAGIGLFVVGAQFLRSILFGVQAFEPMSSVAAVGVLSLTVLVAMYIPARRAGQTDPARVLRGE